MEQVNISALRVSAAECQSMTSLPFLPTNSPPSVATVTFRRTSATVLLSASSSHFLGRDIKTKQIVSSSREPI